MKNTYLVITKKYNNNYYCVVNKIDVNTNLLKCIDDSIVSINIAESKEQAIEIAKITNEKLKEKGYLK